jgi:hypothetical protein
MMTTMSEPNPYEPQVETPAPEKCPCWNGCIHRPQGTMFEAAAIMVACFAGAWVVIEGVQSLLLWLGIEFAVFRNGMRIR